MNSLLRNARYNFSFVIEFCPVLIITKNLPKTTETKEVQCVLGWVVPVSATFQKIPRILGRLESELRSRS